MTPGIGYRLYLTKEWAEDEPRRKQAGVPDDVVFETKTAIALGLLEQALAQDIPRGFVPADAGYGSDTAFREAVTALGLRLAPQGALVYPRALREHFEERALWRRPRRSIGPMRRP